jgi:hypothetical protein
MLVMRDIESIYISLRVTGRRPPVFGSLAVDMKRWRKFKLRCAFRGGGSFGGVPKKNLDSLLYASIISPSTLKDQGAFISIDNFV